MKTRIRDVGATLALLGRVGVLVVEVLVTTCGLTIYREGRNTGKGIINIQHMALCNATKHDDMSCLIVLEITLQQYEAI